MLESLKRLEKNSKVLTMSDNRSLGTGIVILLSPGYSFETDSFENYAVAESINHAQLLVKNARLFL